MKQHVVALETGGRPTYFYGPFDDKDEANLFAQFLSAEVDPAHVISLFSPTDELIGFWQKVRNDPAMMLPATKPEHWPPKPGQVWQDRELDRWVCAGTNASNTPYLVCIARQADDSAEEILSRFGPLKLVYTFDPHEEEPPF